MAKRFGWLISSACLLAAAPGVAQPPAAVGDAALSQEDRIAELERTVQVLSEELARTRVDVAVPEDAASLESQWGYGPAASKVYERDRGLSIGGYGEGFYTNYVSDQGSGTGKTLDRADMLRAVLYTGYRFNEHIVFNSEIEFEHASTSEGGSVSVEFAALDFFWRPELNFRTGLVLLPVGFLNLVHEPPFFYGVNRPDVERALIPSTWRENGAGIFGQLGETVDYTIYAVNGMDARGFNANGIRGGRQYGGQALAEDLAFVGRVDWTPMPELELGAAVYAGASGQDQRISLAGGGSTELPSTPTVLWEVHGQYESRGLHLRSLFTMTHLGDAGSLTGDLRAAASSYNLKDFRLIYPWHHAAGDFIAKSSADDQIDVRLTTVRGYEPFMGFDQHAMPPPALALYYFLLHLSIQMRLDKFDGVGNVAWADDLSVDATVAGFLAGLERRNDLNECCGSAGNFLTLLKSFTAEDLGNTVVPIAAQFKQTKDYPVIEQHLKKHVARLYLILQNYPLKYHQTTCAQSEK